MSDENIRRRKLLTAGLVAVGAAAGMLASLKINTSEGLMVGIANARLGIPEAHAMCGAGLGCAGGGGMSGAGLNCAGR